MFFTEVYSVRKQNNVTLETKKCRIRNDFISQEKLPIIKQIRFSRFTLKVLAYRTAHREQITPHFYNK